LPFPAFTSSVSIGFLLLWFITEVFQVMFILRLNQRMFMTVATLKFAPVYRLFALISGRLVCRPAAEKPLLQIATTALIFVAVLACISYPLFELNDVKNYMVARMSNAREKSV
jgi:hypothetical protein